MKKKIARISIGGLVLFVLFVLMPPPRVFGAACTSNGTGGGNWKDAGTWQNCHSSSPTTSDSVTVQSGDIVTVTTNRQADSVTIEAGGTLSIVSYSVRILTAGNTFTVDGTLEFPSPTTGFIFSDVGEVILTMGPGGCLRTARTTGSPLDPNDPTPSVRQTAPGSWNLSSLDSSGTVEFNAVGNQTITDRNFNNLVLSGSGTKTWTLGASRTLNGSLSITGSAALVLGGAFTMNVKGNWTNTSSIPFAHNAGTVAFGGNGTLVLNKTGDGSTEVFCNLTINNDTLLDTTDDFIAVLSSAGCGALTQDGKLRRAAPARLVTGNGSAVTYLDSRGLVTAQISQTGGTDLGSTSLTVTSNESPGAVPCGSTSLGGKPVLRYYDISPTTRGGGATLRLYYRTSGPDESNANSLDNLAIYHCDGAVWTRLSGSYLTGNDANGNFVQLDGVNTFSPFAIGGGPDAPTAVTLSSFDAQPTSADSPSRITLAWTTASEINTAGFNIYRSEKPDGPYVRMNAQLIPASADPLVGGRYAYQDTSAGPGQTCYYQLEDVELNGTSTRHAPISVTVASESDSAANAPILIGFGIAALALAGVGFGVLRKRFSAA